VFQAFANQQLHSSWTEALRAVSLGIVRCGFAVDLVWILVWICCGFGVDLVWILEWIWCVFGVDFGVDLVWIPWMLAFLGDICCTSCNCPFCFSAEDPGVFLGYE
jgi:hypothetical protein